MGAICDHENLKVALKRVICNKGTSGVDGMTVEALPAYLKEHWPLIKERLHNCIYKPLAVKKVEIPKPGGGKRMLGIPAVLDRFIQQAILQVLQPIFDPTFSDHSYGFRPGRSAHQAISRAQEYIVQGYSTVVDMDLEKFFDRVNHDKLMSEISKRISDKRVLKLLRAYLNAGIMEGGLSSPRTEGVPQGGPLSPLLSNIMLDLLDKELTRRGHRFVRYADDCNIYVGSMRAGERVMKSVSTFIAKRLKLKVNSQKSAVGSIGERVFLGFCFTYGETPKRRIAPKALERCKERVLELTRASKSMNLEVVIANLRKYLMGWRSYYGFCQTPSVLRNLEAWIRRRLRSLIWRQWRRGVNRFAQLRKMGINKDLAAQTAGSPKGIWRISNSPALAMALPNAYFSKLGLPSLVK
jgi:RNA-directed DNA polymerase